MSKKFIISAAVMVVIIAVVSIAWRQGKPTPAPRYTGPVEKIVVANQREYSIFNLVAKEMGYFTENGLDAEVHEYVSGAPAAADLLAGKVDVACVGEFVAVSNIFADDQLRIIAETSRQKSVRLVARRDRGIERPADLRGKKIGVTLKTASDIFASKFLTFNNLAYSDVEIIDLSPLQIIEGISAGAIDAAVTFEPYPFAIEKELGANAISWSAQGVEDTYAIFISREEFIKNQPLAIKRYLKALAQAEQYVKDHEAEAKKILARAANYDEAYISYYWPKITFYLALEQQFILVLEDEARWAIINKLTDKTKVPNYLDYIYLDALTTVKPEAVTIIR